MATKLGFSTIAAAVHASTETDRVTFALRRNGVCGLDLRVEAHPITGLAPEVWSDSYLLPERSGGADVPAAVGRALEAIRLAVARAVADGV